MHQQEPSWRSISWCSKVMKTLHMNQYLRYTRTYLSCVIFGMCCQRGRVYYHIFLKFVEICKRESLLFSFNISKRESLLRGRFLQITKVWGGKIYEGEKFYQWKVLFSNFSMLWHVVLPSMPKREIVGYNYPIMCCLWCCTNVISAINQCLTSFEG